MHELIFNNQKIIFLCDYKNHNINNKFYNNLKKIINLKNSEKDFFNSILSQDFKMTRSKNKIENFKKKFINAANVNYQNNIRNIIKRDLKFN